MIIEVIDNISENILQLNFTFKLILDICSLKIAVVRKIGDIEIEKLQSHFPYLFLSLDSAFA